MDRIQFLANILSESLAFHKWIEENFLEVNEGIYEERTTIFRYRSTQYTKKQLFDKYKNK